MNTKITKKLFIGLFSLTCLSFPASIQAESLAKINSFIAQLGPVSQDSNGAINVHGAVLSALAQGQISPLMQLALYKHVMTKCTSDAIEKLPKGNPAQYRAKHELKRALCKIEKCSEQLNMLNLLVESSKNKRFGGSSSSNSRKNAAYSALLLAQTSQKKGACGKGGKTINSQLILLLQAAMKNG